ncbi:MAG: TIGR03663 family protein [Chloroflexi bacterium]|nr:TIGR03663 family protein [Chloroflexota bacterium]
MTPDLSESQTLPESGGPRPPRSASLFGGLLSWEAAFYLGLIAIAGVMRFWDLGARAIHHDESLHAFFSIDFLGGYKHNPLMHGPFQFLGLNLIFNIFGASDTAARALAAAFGTALVGMPYLLRSYMGRWGSVVASTLIAFSPSLLYFSRFARNDALMAVWTLGLVIVTWRYLSQGKARYLYIGAALLSLSFATKENSYITLIVLGSFFFLLWLRQPSGRAGGEGGGEGKAKVLESWVSKRLGRLTAVLGRLGPYLIPSPLVFVLAAGWVISAVLWSLDIFDIFGRVDLTFSLVSLGIVVGVYIAILPWLIFLRRSRVSPGRWMLNWWWSVPGLRLARGRFGGWTPPPLSGPGALWLLLVLLPLPLMGAAAGLLQGPLGLTLANPNSLEGMEPDHRPGFPDGAPVGEVSLAIAVGIVMYLFVISVAIGLKWDRRKFLISGAVFWGIFLLLYTTLFTNPGQGLGSGLWQSLGYWIAQQDVGRGAQPWYYYLILGGTYEFLALALVVAAAVWYLLWRRENRIPGLWVTQGFLLGISALFLLSIFWMPQASGYQLAIGSLLLASAVALLAFYGHSIDRAFLRGRVIIADIALVLLFILNWELPRLIDVWGLGALESLWDVRTPLNALILVGALALVTFKSLRYEDRFTWFLVYWLGAGLVLYSTAGEKMPWLLVHTALPLAMLGGKIGGRLLERVHWQPRLELRWALGVVGALVIGLMTFQSVRVSVEAAYGIDREGNGDIPVEILVYTQTSPDIIATLARIDRLAEETGLGPDLPIIIDRTSGFEYPWRWYLRDYKKVQWPCYDDNPDDATCRPLDSPPDVQVVIVHFKNQSASLEFLGEFDGGRRIRHRAWFPEFETYKRGFEPLVLEDFFNSLVRAGSWREWWDYFAYRELGDDKPLGSEDSVVFFRQSDVVTDDIQMR